jgi:acyl-CoA synthetase (AMP-forming)/AMP-acid ligase II
MNQTAPLSILSQIQTLYGHSPDRVILTFVDEAGRDHEKLTVRQLSDAASAIAQLLRENGLTVGDRAILCYLPSIEFVKAFIGCIAAGVIPVAVYPPNLLKLDLEMPRFEAILANSGARAVLTHGEYERVKMLRTVGEFFKKNKPKWPDVPWLRTDRASQHNVAPEAWHVPPDQDAPAFLQYTSGSTGSPKGVVVTHRNLVDELSFVTLACNLRPGSRGAVWAPQYHDMGLIILLSAVVGNIDMHFMSPLSFLKRPAIWFEVMDRIRATHTASPNFALDLSVRKTRAEDRARWDLSHLHTLICAAEPIRLSTVRSFFNAFASSGLETTAFLAGYGLAEHTLSISFCRGPKFQLLDKAALAENRVVISDSELHEETALPCFSCGPLQKEGGRVRIVDPDTLRPCSDGNIGEIWVDSSTKAGGYYGLDDENRKIFHARVRAEADATEYLRTGDLGFLHEGELYVTGRCKDLIIINGRNLYPQDIEDSIRGCHPMIRPGGLAAFAIENEATRNERLVLFIELQEDKSKPEQIAGLIRTVRHRVFEAHQAHCHALVLGKPGTVKKTTSGKIRRRACKEAFVSGEIHQTKTTIKIDMQQQPGVLPLVSRDFLGSA